MMGLWNLHAHSRFSSKDALPSVQQMVDTVVGYGQPALGLTDHGNTAGSVQLYQACADAGIKAFPGSELYVVHSRDDKKAKRHHMCVVAFTSEGYENLVQLSSLSHRNFYNKPILDAADLAGLSDAGMLNGIAATSGCYFGFISQAMVSGDEAAVRMYMASYSKWFDKFYVELQNHEIDHGDGWTDSLLANALLSISEEMGIPSILTQDSHYCDVHDKEIHDALKRLVAFGPEEDDAVFPGDGFHLADSAWFQSHHGPRRLEAGLQGLTELLDIHDLSIPQLDKYSYNIPFTFDDPMIQLRHRCFAELERRGLDNSDRYIDRMLTELKIIRDTGMAGYLMLVAEVTDWCFQQRIFYQARGSASGSIVCWLLNITQVDPIKWKLDFERFISRDRTKPPDIDLDVEHARRRELIEWLRSRFAVTQIGTWRELSLDEEEDLDGEGSKGSIRVKYYSRWKATNPDKEAPVWSDIPAEDRRLMHALSDYKSFDGYGVHAAGLVVTTTQSELDRLVPTMYVASSGTTVTQYEMDDIEALGLVKLDVLGLKTLTVLNRTMVNLGRDPFDGLNWIPLTDRPTYAAIAKGLTDGVFQLEGKSAKFGVRELKPTKIRDIIAAMALFRPATMNSGATAEYIERRHGDAEVPVRHEILNDATRSTYGIFLFQEQVIQVLRKMGMEANDLTKFLKAVKASNSNIGNAGKVIQGYHDLVMSMAIGIGMREDDFLWLWESVTGFAAYGFNQAHSTAYGLTAYRCAYLSVHHPVEFYAALLSVAAGNKKKEPQYLSATRRAGVAVRRADINESDVSYVPTKRGIRKGLTSIKGIKTAAEELIAKRPPGGYESVEQLCRLVEGRKVTGVKAYLTDGDLTVGTIGKLYEAGALDSILEGK